MDKFLDMVRDMSAAFDDFIHLGGGDITLSARSSDKYTELKLEPKHSVPAFIYCF